MELPETEYLPRHADPEDVQRVSERPRGVTIIAGIAWAGASFLACSAGLVTLGRAPLALGAPLLNGLETLGPLTFCIAAVLTATTGYGLLKLHRWSRRGAIALAAWIIAAAVPGASSAVTILNPWGMLRGGGIIIGSVMAIRYLIDAPVRAAFDRG